MKIKAADLLLKQQRFDLIFKYLYLKNKCKSTSFFTELYSEHIRAFNDFFETNPNYAMPKNSKEDFIQAFDRLYESMSINGFDASIGKIPIGTNGEITDGAHRLTCAAILGLDVDTEQGDNCDLYDYNFFKKRGLNSFYSDYAALEYVKLNPNAYIVSLHSIVSKSYDPEVEKILNKYGFIFYKKDICLNFNGYVNLKKISYGPLWDKEQWIGDGNNAYAGAQAHAENSFHSGSPMRGYVFVCDDLSKVISAKAEIRQLVSIGNYSVHINDFRGEAVQLAEIYFNDHSLDMINIRDFRFFDKDFESMLSNLKEKAKNRGVDFNDICISGSAPMNVIGLRKSQDIDFLYDLDENFNLHTDKLSSHDSELVYYPQVKTDIIYNPKHHFYYNGLKFITLNILFQMKTSRHEIPKDVRDCKLISSALKKIDGLKTKGKFNWLTWEKKGREHNFKLFDRYQISYKEINAFKKDLRDVFNSVRKKNVAYSLSNPLKGNKCLFEDPLYKLSLVKRTFRHVCDWKKIQQVYWLLGDVHSRNLFLNIILFRLLGPNRISLPLENAERWEKLANMEKLCRKADVDGNAKLFSYDFQEIGYPLKLVTTPHWVLENLFLHQYIYASNGVKVSPETDDYIIDAGACFGDNSICFSLMAGERGRVYAFEANPSNLKVFKDNLKKNSCKNVEIVEKCISNKSGETLKMSLNGGATCVSSKGEFGVYTISIDDFITTQSVPRIDFIKMDIEGMEQEALHGAKNVIRKHRPKLAISVYHKFSDYWEIPLLIKSLAPNYNFYFDHYTACAWESVLYAIPEEKQAMNRKQ